MIDSLTRSVRAALAANPSSLRALARGAGVSHVLLLRIRDGVGRATPPVAGKLAAALEVWAATCTRRARVIRRAIITTRRTRP